MDARYVLPGGFAVSSKFAEDDHESRVPAQAKLTTVCVDVYVHVKIC